MKIMATSDLYGNLEGLNPKGADVVVLAGDVAPLRVSRRTLRNRLRANVGGSLNKEFTKNY